MSATASHVPEVDCTCPICQLVQTLSAAQSSLSPDATQNQLESAVSLFRKQPDILDGTMFDSLAPIVDCANVSSSCSQLVADYLQLVIKHCSGREVLTILMATLDAKS